MDCLSINPISTGGRCFPRKLCLPVDNFFSFGSIATKLVTFLKNYHSRGAWKKIQFLSLDFSRDAFFWRGSRSRIFGQNFFQDLNCNQITVTINNNRDYWK